MHDMRDHSAWVWRSTMQCSRPTFKVIAHRLDGGARWELDAVDVPEAHVEVIDLADGAETMRTLLAEHLHQPIDDVNLQIVLT